MHTYVQTDRERERKKVSEFQKGYPSCCLEEDAREKKKRAVDWIRKIVLVPLSVNSRRIVGSKSPTLTGLFVFFLPYYYLAWWLFASLSVSLTGLSTKWEKRNAPTFIPPTWVCAFVDGSWAGHFFICREFGSKKNRHERKTYSLLVPVSFLLFPFLCSARHVMDTKAHSLRRSNHVL